MYKGNSLPLANSAYWPLSEGKTLRGGGYLGGLPPVYAVLITMNTPYTGQKCVTFFKK